MKRIVLPLLTLLATVSLAEETSFRSLRLPNLKGKPIKVLLTFSDNDKAVEVHPAKGDSVTIPYRQIEKCSYEYTTDVMGGKTHWLQIDYDDQAAHKVLVLRMDKHYLRILDALKTHTGIDAQILGNVDKGLK